MILPRYNVTNDRTVLYRTPLAVLTQSHRMIVKTYNKKLILICPILILLSATFHSCSFFHPEDQKRHPVSYEVMGKTYYPLSSARGFKESGIASWYGKKFHGLKTANGEVYNMYGISAAHKTLPLGTYVSVKNVENGKKIVVRINDRGPFVNGRIIDLSYAAAKKLDIIEPGTARVEIIALE